MARILLTTFGSLGDLNPYIALGRSLAEHGHTPVVATAATYREIVLAAGLEHRPVAPDIGPLVEDPEVARRANDPRWGSRYVVREILMPHLRESFDDLATAVADADLLVSHPLTYAAPLVAEIWNLPWLSVALSPLSLMSVHDPPVIPAVPGLELFNRFGPSVYRAVFALARRTARTWGEPVRELRRDLGLPPTSAHPLFEGQYSPFGTLALFSRVLAQPQPDWPPKTTVTGFLRFDRPRDPGRISDAELASRRFRALLETGERPLVFTLGTAAVFAPGDFFEKSIEAARRLGRRAVLVAGPAAAGLGLGEGSAEATAFDYLPYSEAFPHAAVVVHQGGIGTMAQALAAGRPMLVVPVSHDQPDNAARARRLGVARVLPRQRYTVDAAVAEIGSLLDHPERSRRAHEVAETIALEDGAARAVRTVEAVLGRGR